MKKYVCEFLGTFMLVLLGCGSAVLAGEALSQVWVFIVGPLVGAAIAALVWKFLAKDEKEI